MKAPLYNQEGSEVGTIELPDALFGAAWNAALVKQVVDVQRSKRRQTVAHTKIRSEVRGSNIKPWRQKGTGRARHGSRRSPLWKGGGVTFGPRSDRSFAKRITKKMGQKALCATLSAKCRDDECIFIDTLRLAEPKTRQFNAFLKRFPRISHKSVAYVNDADPLIERAARNIKGLAVYRADQLNALDVLQKKYLVLPSQSIEVMKKTFLK